MREPGFPQTSPPANELTIGVSYSDCARHQKAGRVYHCSTLMLLMSLLSKSQQSWIEDEATCSLPPILLAVWLFRLSLELPRSLPGTRRAGGSTLCSPSQSKTAEAAAQKKLNDRLQTPLLSSLTARPPQEFVRSTLNRSSANRHNYKKLNNGNRFIPSRSLPRINNDNNTRDHFALWPADIERSPLRRLILSVPV